MWGYPYTLRSDMMGLLETNGKNTCIVFFYIYKPWFASLTD